jgi:cobyrinic acid a,c-diamide synthase
MQDDSIEIPRILIAAVRGGAGKTVLAIGIIAAFRNQGHTVAPFKKGPDYIDAGWLALAAGRPCFNLDAFMAGKEAVCRSFLSRATFGGTDIAVIEGNRGLYDGLDLSGTTSTASLAKLLNTPVILCIDCTKSTRSMAAVVLGCLHFDPEVRIYGVILNRVAGARHENILRKSIETYCGVPVIGAVPRLDGRDFPERHMGLIPTPEHTWGKTAIEKTAQVVADYVDLSAVLQMAKKAPGFPLPCPGAAPDIGIRAKTADGINKQSSRPRIGIVKDSAFQFYYPENIEAISQAGAEPVFISPLNDASLADIDALYIGGGFPETHAAQLSRNVTFRNAVRSAATNGMPIYAECGGLMYLGKALVLDKEYPMAGVLPVVFGFSQKPQGHGYTIATVDRNNPFFETGTVLKGHEFHYSRVLEWNGDDRDLVFAMSKGRGIRHKRDGICYKNVLATYTHIHALGTPQWAQTLVRIAAFGPKNGR